MKEINNHINQTIEEINEVSSYLYQQKLNQGYTKLNITLGNIMSVLDEIFSYTKDNNISFDENRLNTNLMLAMGALEEKDSVLLADILVYEIAEQLKEIESLI
jgi:hypothetical protein